MKKIKTIGMIVLIGISASLFTGCKKSGCTNKNATNYDSKAKDNQGCKFQGQIVFWYGKSTSDFLINDNALTLTYYVDGKVAGSSATSVYWTGAPSCGQNGSITVTQDLGSAETKTYSYSVKDQTGFEYWNGTVVFEGNTCTATELSK